MTLEIYSSNNIWLTFSIKFYFKIFSPSLSTIFCLTITSESRKRSTRWVCNFNNKSDSISAFLSNLHEVYPICFLTSTFSSLADANYSVMSCGKSLRIILSLWLAILPTSMQLLALRSVTCEFISSDNNPIDFRTRSEWILYSSKTKL